jgi:hypothetical protein
MAALPLRWSVLDMNSLDTTLWSMLLRPCKRGIEADRLREHKLVIDEPRRFIVPEICHRTVGLVVVYVPRIDDRAR